MTRATITTVLALAIFGCGDDDPVETPPASDLDASTADAHADSGPGLEDAPPPTDAPDAPELDAPTGDDADAGPPPPPPETGPGLGIDWDAVEPGATPDYDPDDNSWFAMGWPNDRYRKADGHLDLSRIPNPGSDLVGQYLEHGEAVMDGFGLNGSVYFRFSDALDVASLPDVHASREPLSVVQLVNVTPGSPRYGERMPLRFRFYSGGPDPYYRSNTLVFRPVFGLPLSEAETWCAVVTRGVEGADGRYLQPAPKFAEELLSEPTLAPLVAWLSDSDLHRADVAVASCFTTHDPTAELRAVRSFLADDEPPVVDFVVEPLAHNEFHGTYLAPNFQAGEKPYDKDGDLRFGADGLPIVQAWETLRFLLLVPHDEPTPETGWPVVLYAHGTGGDYESCRGTSAELMADGHALLCIDQPLHGSRGPEGGEPLTDEELITYSFNFLNAPAGRMSFRQSAIDTITLTQMVASGRFDLAPADTLSGEGVLLDPARVSFFGHSHGALSGALVLAVEPLLTGGVLSGGGAGLINTILLRKDPLDIAAFVVAVLQVEAAAFDEFHPMLSIVQMLVDATDSVNYAPFWLNPHAGGTPKHVFVTEGTSDHASPQITGDTLGAAAQLPMLLPIAKASLAHELLGLTPEAGPAIGNVTTSDGPRTAAMRQWQDGTHWVAFQRSEGRASWRTFLRTLADPGVDPEIGIGDLTVAFAAPIAVGEGCADAGTLEGSALPALVIGNTSLATDELSSPSVGGEGTRDQVFRFVPEVHGVYYFDIDIPPKGKNDPPTGPDRMYVLTDCADPGGSELGSTGNNMTLELTAGVPVWVVADGTSPPHRGAFEILVSSECAEQDCGDRECGSFGCGSCGTCAGGQICTPDGFCEAAAAGDTCADALAIGALPFDHVGDSRLHAADYHYEKGWCPGFNAKYGQGSSDVAYAFTAPAAGVYTMTLDAHFDASLFVVTDCADIAGTCLAAHRSGSGQERINVTLEQGEAVFVIVDGAANSINRQGWYRLRVQECAPTCGADQPCGSDSCGGSCGECLAAERCVDETKCDPIPYLCTPAAVCEEVLEGDTCGKPFVVDAIPFSASGSTEELQNEYSYGGGQCPGSSKSWGHNAPDAVYTFVPAEAALYDFTLSASFDSNLYVVEDCGAIGSSCLGAHQVEKKNGGERVLLQLDAGQTVVVVVDGASSSSQKGTYTLKIDTCVASCEGKDCGSDGCGGSCGGCPATQQCNNTQCGTKTGDTCGKPRGVGKLPYTHSSGTGNFTNAATNTCAGAPEGSGDASNDVTYRFEAPATATFAVRLEASFAAQLVVTSDCADVAGTCVTQTAGEAPPVELELDLEKGTKVYLTIDGDAAAPDEASGNYTLKVWQICVPDCTEKDCGTNGCGGSCGSCAAPTDVCGPEQKCVTPGQEPGGSCATAIAIDATALPVTLEGSTEESGNYHAVADDACPGWVGKGWMSNDIVYSFVPPSAGEYVFSVSPEEFDAALYLLSDCSVAVTPETCLAAWDGRAPDTLSVVLQAGEPVHLVIDGASNEENEAGAFTLTVTPPAAE